MLLHVTVCVEGVNLEKLLREAAQEGIVIRSARRRSVRMMRLRVRADQLRQLEELCARSGWTLMRMRSGIFLRLYHGLRMRPVLAPALLLACLLVMLSSQMILRIRVEGAGKDEPQVRRVLRQEDVYPGRLKRGISLDGLRAALAHRLPDLSYTGAYFAGSTLILDCHEAVQGENLLPAGSGMDIVAAKSGIVSRIWASSGTPQVESGQAVHKGQVLIAGYERGEKGTQIPVQAQGIVLARLYVSGEAKVSLMQTDAAETGRRRTRVLLRTPWSSRVIRDAAPFDSQYADRQIQHVVGLYLPLWREIETFVETQTFSVPRSYADCALLAQGAAEKIARKQCPPGALILDKIVNYSMIDNEFVYASVVLEYEAPIAGRIP